jgi:hypothetical protein
VYGRAIWRPPYELSNQQGFFAFNDIKKLSTTLMNQSEFLSPKLTLNFVWMDFITVQVADSVHPKTSSFNFTLFVVSSDGLTFQVEEAVTATRKIQNIA